MCGRSPEKYFQYVHNRKRISFHFTFIIYLNECVCVMPDLLAAQMTSSTPRIHMAARLAKESGKYRIQAINKQENKQQSGIYQYASADGFVGGTRGKNCDRSVCICAASHRYVFWEVCIGDKKYIEHQKFIARYLICTLRLLLSAKPRSHSLHRYGLYPLCRRTCKSSPPVNFIQRRKWVFFSHENRMISFTLGGELLVANGTGIWPLTWKRKFDKFILFVNKIIQIEWKRELGNYQCGRGRA